MGGHQRLILSLLLAGILAGCASGGRRGTPTTLSDPSASFQKVDNGKVEITWSGSGDAALRAMMIDNRAKPPLHQGGYNGLTALHITPDGGEEGGNLFMPVYAGFSLQSVINGEKAATPELQFEPRTQPMELRKIGEGTFELYQAPLPNSGVETCTRFVFRSPNIIDVTSECIAHEDKFPNGYLGLMWGGYILKPADPAIYFYGRPRGDDRQKVVKAVSPADGEKSTHRNALDDREYKFDPAFEPKSVFAESELEYTRPFFWGRFDNNALMVMFNKKDNVRFSQTPSGGGEGNPTWNYIWFIDKPEVGKIYRLAYRVVYEPWVDGKTLVEKYERFRKGR